MNHNTLQSANRIATTIYKKLLTEVVEKHAINDHRGQARRSDREKKAQAADKETDIRVLYLCSISGKGGWTDNPKKQASYLKNSNITLLDHLLSVSRGAIVLAAMDLLSLNPDIDKTLLTQRLKVIAAIAFLHDLDKMERVPRDEPLSLKLVESVIQQYEIHAFLGEDITLDAAQIRYLIEHAEDSQAHRHPANNLPPRYYERDIKNYVSLADKLDGTWQQYGEQKGLEQLLDRLNNTQGLQSEVLKQWQAISLFDPHHPFLLDELQRNLSALSQRLAHISPLIEIHQDGRLFILLPKEQAADIQEKALQRLCRNLPFSLYLNISTVGVPELINEKADYQRYTQFIEEDIDSRLFARIFTVKKYLVSTITPFMDELLTGVNLKPQWPASSGQTTYPYADPTQLGDIERSRLKKAASLALLLNLKLVRAKNVPDYLSRETQLLHLIDEPLPEWIANIDSKAAPSKRILIALWAMVQAEKNTQLNDAIWSETGLLQQWLEGNEQYTGFNTFFEDQGTQVLSSIKRHFSDLMNHNRLSVSAKNQTAAQRKKNGHCIFTDAPTDICIADKMKLYGIKVSAFAGREGRPESIASAAKGQVHISHISLAEYKLRQDAFIVQGGKSSGVPSLISSPVTTGLFSGLILDNEQSLQALSVYDLQRKKILKGKVNYQGLENYRKRYRMARFECMPTKLSEQIDLLRLLLSSCLRIGRPIHIFRGLPTPQKAFFYYDAMPAPLLKLLGFKELRIEQIPNAIRQLAIARELIETAGLGHNVFQRYADTKTRLSAACLALCHLKDREMGTHQLRNRLEQDYQYLTQENKMSQHDGALVQLGHAAARIQRSPLFNASSNEETLCFNIALDSLLNLRAQDQLDKATLSYGIAGELETNLFRKDKMAASKYREGKSLQDECIQFAQQFVDTIWDGVLKQRPPSQSNRRLLSSVYRIAFLQASRNKKNTDTNNHS